MPLRSEKRQEQSFFSEEEISGRSSVSISPSSTICRKTDISNLVQVPQQEKTGRINLKKEYVRFCKLYSSEPLDIVASPLEKATYDRDNVVVDLKGRGLRGVDCIALGRILALDPPIKQLNLSDCLLLPQGFQALVDGLCKNKRLEILELRGNNIQTAMTASLGKLLKSNDTLKSLLLEWNCLGVSRDTFLLFCDGLSSNKGLETLDLRNNQLTAECGADLATSLRKNKKLRVLDLRWNSIGLLGAKALWESLRFNFTLTKIHLCGNFIPEDVVLCIEGAIAEQGQREILMEEYARRTTILTRQLQRNEKEHENEIHTIVSVFDAEEAEYKEAIMESQEQIQKLHDQLKVQLIQIGSLTNHIEKLEGSLQLGNEKEETLQKALEIKEKQTEHLERRFKSELLQLKGTNETKLKIVLEELENKKTEIKELREKLKKLENSLEGTESNLTNNSEVIEGLKKELEETRISCEERVKREKEKWNSWKSEVETSEKREIEKLENEINTIQQSMNNHIKSLEKGKGDAEEELRNLRISLVTLKTASEEENTKLRKKLEQEFSEITLTHEETVNGLREKINKLESESQVQSGVVRKLESENSMLLRQNDNMRQQLNHMTLELNEKDSTIQSSLLRARAEVKEQLEQLGKEEAANRELRTQNLELQEQIAKLTLKQSREIQEKFSEMERWKTQVERREEELNRLKEEDMRRAGLLHEAFLAYMRSTAAATGLPLPSSYYTTNEKNNPSGDGAQN